MLGTSVGLGSVNPRKHLAALVTNYCKYFQRSNLKALPGGRFKFLIVLGLGGGGFSVCRTIVSPPICLSLSIAFCFSGVGVTSPRKKMKMMGKDSRVIETTFYT